MPKNKIAKDRSYPFYSRYNLKDYIIQHDCRSHTTLRERGEPQEYRINNTKRKEIVIYKIDGGVINNDSVHKCDYGVYTEEDILYLIELKGDDLDLALEQIVSTINILLKTASIPVRRLNARIVLSRVRVPSTLYTKEKKLKNILMSYGRGDYIKKCKIIEDTV